MNNQEIKAPKKDSGYKWIIFLASFLMVFICLGFCSSTKSLFISPVTEHLGIDRSVYSINDSLRFISVAVASIFFGPLITKFGTRKLIAAGFLSLTASMLCYALAEHALILYLGGIFLGIGLSLTTTTMVGYVVTTWTEKNKGVFMSLVLAGSSFGGSFAVQILHPIIEINAGIPGYKLAYFAIAVILLAYGAAVVTLHRDKNELDVLNDATYPRNNRLTQQNFITAKSHKVVNKWFFWVALACAFFTGFALQAVSGVAAVQMYDVGFSSSFVVDLFNHSAMAAIVMNFIIGFIYDRTSLRTAANVCSKCAILAAIALMSITYTYQGFRLSEAYIIFIYAALPLENLMIPLFAYDLFGKETFKNAIGPLMAATTLGLALASPCMNLCYDLLGTYRPGFVVSIVAMIGVTIMLQFVISSAYKTKERNIFIKNQIY